LKLIAGESFAKKTSSQSAKLPGPIYLVDRRGQWAWDPRSQSMAGFLASLKPFEAISVRPLCLRHQSPCDEDGACGTCTSTRATRVKRAQVAHRPPFANAATPYV
jgi:hypothetical protein